MGHSWDSNPSEPESMSVIYTDVKRPDKRKVERRRKGEKKEKKE